MTQVSNFNYELPEELIAQQPPTRRGDSRMLVISRTSATFRDDVFANFPRYIKPGDCLVLNNTRVFPARLHGTKAGGAHVEVFLTRPLDNSEKDWAALVRPGRRVRVGDVITFAHGLTAEILTHGDFGERTVRLHGPAPIRGLLDRVGQVPLPPYIHRAPSEADSERYQTVFAENRGSVAAPTAGLHFTPEVLQSCRSAGAEIAFITLHVGLGTFAPIRSTTVEDIRLHAEPFRIEEPEATKIRAAKRALCVGTTSVRTLESASSSGSLAVGSGETELFIRPGYRFRTVGAMLTNFHLPQSSLLMLVAAFAGKDLTLAAYRHAVAERYRFFSYGDCMLIE